MGDPFKEETGKHKGSAGHACGLSSGLKNTRLLRGADSGLIGVNNRRISTTMGLKDSNKEAEPVFLLVSYTLTQHWCLEVVASAKTLVI